MTSTRHPLVLVKRSSIHGRGGFARTDIKKGTWIIEYKGEKITKKEAEKRAEKEERTGRTYIFEVNKRYDIDGASKGNQARFINHTKKNPNCEAICVQGKSIWIKARRNIEKGEELLYDYGFSL